MGMGENRPKAMRGGGMEDVIFAGASSRPARNYAEVSLLIDNTQRLAPAAFNTQDVLEIIRRITRDVGSAYKTNGKDSRAKDVQMLFLVHVLVRLNRHYYAKAKFIKV